MNEADQTPQPALNAMAAISESPVRFGSLDSNLWGDGVEEMVRSVGDLSGIFADEAARAALPQARVAYRVRSYRPPAGEASGVLLFGVTLLAPGVVGNEYFMTKGHFHARRDATEYYWCLRGQGVLLLMDKERRCRAEWMRPGSLHFIPGDTGHRTVNTGSETLCFGACWPADAGHDYGTIAQQGFSARILRVGDQPKFVAIP